MDPNEPAPGDSPPPPPSPSLSLAARVGGMVWELVKTSVIVAILVVTIRTFVVEAYVIQGNSMEPSLKNDDRIIISKFSHWLGEPERGDVVVFEHTEVHGLRRPPSRRLIKRVIGLPGEKIEIRGGRVYIDGARQPLDEPYLDAGHPDLYSDYGPKVIPAGHFFVLGDNRPVSNDSRRFSFVPDERILGKAWFRFWKGSSDED